MFHTSDALRDERVRTHPKREKVQAYCGVPLLNAQGALFGSICHFDFDPRVIADKDVDLMESVAYLLREEGLARMAAAVTIR